MTQRDRLRDALADPLYCNDRQATFKIGEQWFSPTDLLDALATCPGCPHAKHRLDGCSECGCSYPVAAAEFEPARAALGEVKP